jgi:hypothetical protein
MKLNSEKFNFKEINENINLIYYDENVLKFWTPKILIPFGLENEYNKYIVKLELDKDEYDNKEHQVLKKLILHIENIIKKKKDIEDIEFKSIIKNRVNKSDLIECRLKNLKGNIGTICEYKDKENNYLKTIFDMPKNSYVKAQIEINGLWDYRTDKKEKNKTGLIVYVNKLIIL